MVMIGNGGTNHDLYLNETHQQSRYTNAVWMNILMPMGKRASVGVAAFLTTDPVLSVPFFFGPSISRFEANHTFGYTLSNGFEITDRLSVGFAFIGALAINGGTLQLDLVSILSDVLGLSLGSGSVNVNTAFEIDIISTSSYNVGLLYRPFDWVSLGFAYKYKNPSKTIIPVRIVGGGFMDDIEMTLEQNSGSPTTITGGIALYPIEGLTIAFDLSKIIWSKDNKPGLRIKSDNPALAADYPYVKPKDVWVPKFGVEWADNLKGKLERVDYAVRAGYIYYKSPYPPAQTAKNQSTIVDNNAHYYTGGLMIGYRPKMAQSKKKGPEFIGIEYFYEYIHLMPRAHKNVANNPAVIVSKGHVVFNGINLISHW